MIDKYNKILQYINKLKLNKNNIIVAIEGRCASGKTTIANKLKEELNATIIHVDDFFLEQKLKTKERLAEVGGNLNYELLRDTLSNIKYNQSFTYQIFDCSIQDYKLQTIDYVSDIVIVEGVYSMHEKLRKLYDGSIYLDVDKETQLNRLKQRSNPFIFNKFINEWIPLEERYFNLLDIKNKTDLKV